MRQPSGEQTLITLETLNPQHLIETNLGGDLWRSWGQTGLLLRNLNEVTILGKPYYLLYIPIMVT